jgi:hypothetical protein
MDILIVELGKLISFTGFRVIDYPTGESYEGEIINDLKHGKGIFKCANCDILEGMWNLNYLEQCGF